MQHRKGGRKSQSLHLKRQKALSDAIASGKSAKGELELIIRAEERREEVASQLERIGTLRHFYSVVPYISIRCDADYADILRKAASGSVSDSVFEKSFRSIIPAIASVELSNKFSLPNFPVAVVTKKPRTKEALWNLDAIGAYEARQYGNGSGMNVAIIDTGVDYSHSQLRERFGSEKGYDFVKNDDDPMDQNGHGTHVAGIAASDSYGVAPGCNLYAVRILDENGSGGEADLIAGIEWCIKNGIDIANMSLGSPVASGALEEVCNYAYQNGLMLVAAAGNSGYGANYPAAFGESVIAVAAVDEGPGHPDFSNIWETNDISAPGVNVIATYPGERYASLTGTSMASPHVAGSLALALSISSNENLEEVMKREAENLGDHETFGAGLIRIDSMAKYLASSNASKSENYISLLSSYLKMEGAVERALHKVAGEAMAEAKRWLQ